MHVMIDIMQVQLNKLYTKSATIYICILNVNKIKKTIAEFYLGGGGGGGGVETRVSFLPKRKCFPPKEQTTMRDEVLYTLSFFLICFTYVAGWLSNSGLIQTTI